MFYYSARTSFSQERALYLKILFICILSSNAVGLTIIAGGTIMKRLQILALFLCLGILSHPLTASAKERFSWKVISGEKITSDESRDDVRGDDDNDSGDKRRDDDNDDDDKRGDHDDDSDDDDKRSDSDDSDDDDKRGDDDNDDDDDSRDEKDADQHSSSKPKYPSGQSIYSSSEIKELIEEKYKERKEALAIEDSFKKTKAVDRINSFILNFAEDPFADKTIAFLGDSITAGNGGSLTLDGSGLNYTDYIAQYTSAKVINLGIGGAPYDGYDNDDAIIYRYQDIPKDTDIIVLFAGINDLFAGSEHFGSLDDLEKGTYCGDIYATFEAIHEDYSDADVYVVITYPNKMEEYTQFTGENWQKYADVQIELADRFDYRVIDLYKEDFMDSKDSKVRNAFFLDDIHPDDLGSEILGRHILVHMLEDYL